MLNKILSGYCAPMGVRPLLNLMLSVTEDPAAAVLPLPEIHRTAFIALTQNPSAENFLQERNRCSKRSSLLEIRGAVRRYLRHSRLHCVVMIAGR